ncbi:MAG: hypothetical protein KIH10_14845 [Candidatus Freyarchaeota archaeon]|nr:hypothetical protein [Candidatus Jordarchaeia archaeon]
MKKVAFAAGIIFLLVGLTLLAFASVTRNTKKVQIDFVQNSWECYWNLTEKEMYIIDIKASEQWRYDYPQEDVPEDFTSIFIEIISPNKAKTRVQAFFIAAPAQGMHLGTLPSLYRTKYLEIDSSSLMVDELYPQIRFSVKYNGTYTIQILNDGGILNWTSGPPNKIILYKEIVVNPYLTIIPVGGIVSLIGVVISAVAATSAVRASAKSRVRWNR